MKHSIHLAGLGSYQECRGSVHDVTVRHIAADVDLPATAGAVTLIVSRWVRKATVTGRPGKQGWALLFGASGSSCLLLLLLLLVHLSVDVGAETFESCGGWRGAAVRPRRSGVHGADVVQRIVLFPLPEVAELSEAQLLWLEARKHLKHPSRPKPAVSGGVFTLTLAVVVRGT